MSRAWEVLSEKVLLERTWLRIEEHHVRLPTGSEIPEFHRIVAPNWVAILALTPDGRALLVDQYRHGMGEVSHELPAGVIEASETPLAAAQRELLEETGYVADNWQELCVLRPEPSRHTNRAHFFVAKNARFHAPARLDDGEDLSVFTRSAGELMAMVEAGEIVHAVHVAALLLAERRGHLSG